LFNNIIAPFPVCPEFSFQKIREKEKFYDEKEYKNLYKDDQPEFLPDCHITETLVIEIKNPD